VIKLLQQLNFFEQLATFPEFKVFLTDYFDSTDLLGMFMSRTADTTESSFSDNLVEIKVILDVSLMLEVEFLGAENDMFTILSSISKLLFLL
jgi:hypothetical protein